MVFLSFRDHRDQCARVRADSAQTERRVPVNTASSPELRTTDPLLPRRPGWALGIVLDGLFAATANVAAYWLRFQGGRFEDFLPGALSTTAFVVVGQVAALVMAGAYDRRPRLDWLFRVIIGILAGTTIAGAAVGLLLGFEGVSRSAFIADAILMTVGAIGWRGFWVLRLRDQLRLALRSADGDLMDRTTELTTLRGMVGSLYRHRELLRNLVFKDLKLKYRGSVFGFLWSLANPLLMTVVYTIAFTFILQVRSEGFVFKLMLGLLSWTFFANSATMSTGSIIDNAGLLKSVRFPRAILPVATVLFNLAQYLLTVSVFLPAMLLLYSVPPSAPMLLFPVFLALQVVFTIGVALLLATGTAFFRDIRHLLEVGLQVLFWTTPVLYELRNVPERLQLLILLSPVSPFVVAYQQLFFYREWPSGDVWLAATTHALGAFIVGALVFLGFEDRLVEQL
jgi:ABC-type polysaccharide/polyol phosphate export permease